MAGNRVISAVLTLKDKDFGSTAKKSASAMSEFERKTKHSTNAVKDFGKSAGSAFGSVAKGAGSILAAIGVTKALSGAFGMIKGSVSSAFDRIDTMESFNRTMTTLTGSASETKAALEATRDAVTGTAYGLDVAAKSVQNYVTRGMDINKATKVVEQWGDAVAFYGDGSNEQFETVSDAIGKMYSKGKVSMDQMNRLTDIGINATDMYAQAVGRDTASVEKDLTSGKVSAEEFLDVVGTAMMEGTNGVEKIAGAAKEAGSTWGATWANMRSKVTRGVEDIIMNIDGMLVSNGLPDMREMVSIFGDKFETVLKSAGEKVPLLTGAVMGMYETIKPVIDWLKDTAFPGIKDELVGMYESAQPALSWIGETGIPLIVDAVVLAVDGFTGLYNFVKEHLPILVPVIAGVAASVLAFKLGVVLMTTAMSIWKGVTTAVTIASALLNGTLALSPFGWVVIAIGAVVAAGVLLYKNWDTVKEKVSQLWTKTKEVFGGMYDWGRDKIQGVANFFQGLSDKVQGFIDKITSFTPPKWVSTIGGAIGNAAGAVGNFVSGSYAVGTNSVPHDMTAEIHKGEMIIPARQSQVLRNQGVNINNIERMGTPRATITKERTVNAGNSIRIAKLADQIVVKEEADIDKIATLFVKKLESVNFNMA